MAAGAFRALSTRVDLSPPQFFANPADFQEEKFQVPTIKYQPHIDGLRAVAVLLVIFHHLGDWAGTTGGYVGVDVFFVISGFLITSIVNVEIEAGQYSFGGFYKRRIVRLAPAYFTVLLATTTAALVWMLPAELLAYARSVIASSVFLANFHIWKEVGGYFGVNADTVPLLHLWSLAVEEQFYLFWPLVLLVGHRLLNIRGMLWAVVVVAVAGTLVSQWGVSHYPAAAYYLLPTRFFELAVGALLAYVPLSKSSRKWAPLASLTGVGLIGYATLVYGKESLFPGYAALAPVLGTAMLLCYGEGTMVGTLLSLPPVRLIGRISYPAYLWHWPIIVFLHLNQIPISIPIGIAILVTTLGLSWLTYRCLELRARRYLSMSPWRVLLGGAVVPIFLSVSVAMVLISCHGLPSRFPDSLNRKSDALLAASDKIRGRCNEGPPTSPLPPEDCILGRADGEVDFLLVGDSHANHFSGFFDVLGKYAGLRGYDMTRSQTAFLPGVDMWTTREGAPDHHENFVPRNQYVSSLLKRQHYKAVVLAAAYTGYYNGAILRMGNMEGHAAFEAGMREAIREARSAAPLVIVVPSVPSLNDGLYDCSMRAERFKRQLDCTMPVLTYLNESAGIRGFFAILKKEFPDVVWINVDELLCDRTKCITELDGIPLYKDRGHLNDVGSRLLAKKWLARFGNPLKAKPPVILLGSK